MAYNSNSPYAISSSERFHSTLESLYDGIPEDIHKYKEMRTQADISPVSILNWLCKSLHLPLPRYSIYNHEDGLYLCSVHVGEHFRSSQISRYRKEESKRDAADIMLDCLLDGRIEISYDVHIYNLGYGQTVIRTPDKSYVDLLSEVCQKRGWEDPLFLVEKEAINWKGFICSVSISSGCWLYEFKGKTVYPKKCDAKEASARHVFNELLGIK
jgi:hypothetical protein